MWQEVGCSSYNVKIKMGVGNCVHIRTCSHPGCVHNERFHCESLFIEDMRALHILPCYLTLTRGRCIDRGTRQGFID